MDKKELEEGIKSAYKFLSRAHIVDAVGITALDILTVLTVKINNENAEDS